MSVPRLQNVYYVVGDTEQARDFYENALGLSLKFSDPGRWVQFKSGDSNFALCIADEAPVGVRGATVVFEVEAIDPFRKRLTDAGAKIIAERDMGGHGTTLSFVDPAGNIVQLFERARWPS
ncbi:VOC family protein [Methylocapsa sp. S129]|uniref:VOC family protein n=1 Tax=Methylocapsa sp. S129 TaxID=1641869 RepID=UPI00131C6D05|nr:VOC family protein [Methylocapsa sp. S129]